MEPTNSIEVEGLVREFKKGPRAVDGIDLRVEPGEIYGFLGPNGAGKSTTVLMLTTLLPPTAGTARVGGYDVVREGPKVRSVIGAALQEAALDPMLTGRDHLRLQSTLQGISRAERKPRSQELLDRVGLSEAADRKVGGYSGGMKRRLDLALALVHRPRILFLDEPTTGLDIQSRTALWDEVARLAHEDGVTVFLTTQYLEEADVLADRVGIIDHGHIVAEGTPQALKADIGLPSVHAIPANEADREQLVSALAPYGDALGTGSREVAVRLHEGLAGTPGRRPRGRRRRRSLSPAWRFRRPRSTTSSSPRPAVRWRAPPRPRPTQPSRPRDRRLATDRSARVALGRPHEPPAGGGRLPADLPDDAPARELGRAASLDGAPRLPHRLLPRVRARRPLHPGRALLDDERGHRPREGHPDGLPEPAFADVDARVRADRRPARRRGDPRPHPGGVLHRGGPDRRRPLRRRPARDPDPLRLRGRDLDQLRRARRLPGTAHRLGRGDPGPLPSRSSSSSFSPR